MISFDKINRTKNVYIAIYILFICLIVFIGKNYFDEVENRIKNDKQNLITSIANIKIKQTSAWIKERNNDAGIIISNRAIANQISGFLTNSNNKEELNNWLKYIALYNKYDSVSIIDRNGVIRLSSSGKIGIVEGNRLELIKTSLKKGEVIITEILKNNDSKSTSLGIIVPLKLIENTEERCVLYFGINPLEDIYPNILDNPTESASIETILIEPKGINYLFMSSLNQHGKNIKSVETYKKEENKIAQIAASGKEGVFEVRDYKGKNVLTALKKIPLKQFMIAVNIDIDEINSSVKYEANLITIIAILIIFVVGVTFVFLWHYRKGEYIKKQLDIEKALSQSEKHYRELFSTSQDGVILSDLDGRYIDCNKAFLELLGYNSADELFNKIFEEITPSEYHQMEHDIFINQLLIRGYCDEYEKEYLSKDGKRIHVSIKSWLRYDTNNEPIGRWAIIRDISDLKQNEAEQELIIKLFRLLNSTNDLHKLVSEILILLQKWSKCQSVGIRLNEGNDYPYFETIGFPEKFVKLENKLCLYDKNGELLVDDKNVPVLDCICGKIIQRRVDSDLPNFTKFGSFWTGSTTTFTEDTPKEEQIARQHYRCNQMGYESVALIPLHSIDGTFGIIQFNDYQKNKFDIKLISLFERIAQNISLGLSQKRASIAVEESEEKFRNYIDNAPDGVFVWDEEGRNIEVNKAACLITGYSKEELTGMNFIQLYSTEDYAKISESFELLKKTGKILFDIPFVKKDGEKKIWNLNSVKIADNRYLCFVKDITERLNNETQLKENSYLLSEAQKIARMGSYVLDIESGFWNSSDELDYLFGIDKNFTKDIANWVQIIHPEDREEMVLYYLDYVIEEKNSFNKEYRICRVSDNEVIWILGVGKLEFSRFGKPIKMIGTITDITERKSVEVTIKNSLHEKEILIRELYHRTKNNMQIICSIIGLKKSSINDINTINLLKEMEDRVRTMALVHHKLYQSKNLSRISFNEYIDDLSNVLFKSYGVEQGKIELVLELEEIQLLIDFAIPCGLLINEFISNSIKYAFPDDRSGKIIIKAKRIMPDKILLSLADDGIGMSEGFDFNEKGTLGLLLIKGISEDQLQGEIQYNTTNGVSFQVCFKDDLYTERI